MNRFTSKQHVPVLDGIRGMAIFLVIVCHTIGFFKIIGGVYVNAAQQFLFFVFGSGWLGVDLFFVLSGYLITGILINSREERNYFINFYARRTLRIFPIFYLYITVVIFVLPMVIPYMSAQITCYYALYYLYLHNFFPFLSGTLPEYLSGHLWSLAVEEHFYLIWPLVVYKVSTRKIFRVGVTVIIGAILLRYYIVFISGFRPAVIEYYAYKFTFSRADSLILGAMLAYAVRNESMVRLLNRYKLACTCGSGLLCIFLLIQAYLYDSYKIISSIGYTLFSLFFTFLIFSLLSARHESLGVRLLNNSLMRFFGKYSYAMYIVHIPVIAFVYANFLEYSNYDPLVKVLILFVATMTATTVISWLSYHLLEKHFLSLKRFFVSERHVAKMEKVALESTH